MSFRFFLQELHRRVTEKTKAAKAHRGIITIMIAAVLVTTVFFAIKANLAQSPAVRTSTPVSSATQSNESTVIPNGGNQNKTAVQGKTLKRIENAASILGIAILTSGSMIIYYRKKKNRIEPLPVLRSEGETH